MPTFKAIAQLAPRVASYVQTAAAGTAPDAYIFINPSNSGEYFEVVEAVAAVQAAGSTGAAASLEKVNSGEAIGAGENLIDGGGIFDLENITAATPTQATLVESRVTRTIGPGDSIVVNTGGTLTGLAGLLIQVTLKPIVVRKTH